MAEESNGNGAAAPAAPDVKMQVLAQFVRDMSFENMVAQKGLTAGRSAARHSGGVSALMRASGRRPTSMT